MPGIRISKMAISIEFSFNIRCASIPVAADKTLEIPIEAHSRLFNPSRIMYSSSAISNCIVVLSRNHRLSFDCTSDHSFHDLSVKKNINDDTRNNRDNYRGNHTDIISRILGLKVGQSNWQSHFFCTCQENSW